MTYSRSDEKEIRNAPARYTLRAFRRGKSDESGAMLRVKRHARRRQRRGSRESKILRLGGRQSPSHGGCGDNRKLVLNAKANRRRRPGRGIRRGGRDATASLVALAAGTTHALGDGHWRLRGNHGLHPHQQQAEQDGGQPFHVSTIATRGRSRLNFFSQPLTSFWRRLRRLSAS